MHKINKILELLGIDFNACLVNSYGAGDEICAHSDDEDTVLKKFGVMSINVGPGSRVFRVKDVQVEINLSVSVEEQNKLLNSVWKDDDIHTLNTLKNIPNPNSDNFC